MVNLTLGQSLRNRDAKFHRSDQIEAALGDRLPGAAVAQGMTEAAYREVVRRDKHVRADEVGQLHYVCAGVVAHAGIATGTATVVAGPYPSAQTFLLHSRPTSVRKIYLDFNGHTTSGTSWNSAYTAGANIVTPAFDLDAAPASFSTAELDRIQLIWQRVVEDFAPFDVDVTTEDPGIEGLRRTTSTDNAYGVRVCIGGSSMDWFGAGAGGVAYLGSFNWNSDTPCFIFTAQLGGGNEKYTAEATSHEVGHTLGLNHDGQTNGTEYYQGHANWAPIMGVGYYADVVQWSKGEYSLANNKQDDLAVIPTYGAPLRTDTVGGDIATATLLSGSSFTVPGGIERRTDLDVFRFTTGAGTVSFSAAIAAPSPNLDTLLSLYDGLGNVITSANPSGMAGALSATVAAGTYYLAIDGAASGDAITGYNDYASLGQYVLNGTVVAGTNQSPVISIASSAPITGTAPLVVNFSSAGTYDPDGSIASYDWNFGDGTAHSTSANPSHSYTAAGTYVASLVVFDNGGLSSSAAITITVRAVSTRVYVSNIAMALDTSRKGTAAIASVTVKNSSGAVVPGATVRGSWSGLTSLNQAVSTNSSGVAIFDAGRVRTSGALFFTVTSISGTDVIYDATLNVETTDSIIVP
jgi:PKD repeat protein